MIVLVISWVTINTAIITVKLSTATAATSATAAAFETTNS